MSQSPLDQPAVKGHNTLETDVLIIGGGVTGAGIMRDLALRGLHTLLIDKRDLCAGASGGNHGLLHSGGRYVSNDRHSAIECRIENEILKRLAPQCVEQTGGLFVAVEGDDLEFAEKFPQFCAAAGISCTEIGPNEALRMEPLLSEKLVKAYLVPDATVDPFRLALENVAHARLLNDSIYRPHTEIIDFRIDNGKITAAICRDNRTGVMFNIQARQYVNAGGAWAMNIAQKAGCTDVNLLYSKGTLLVSHDRMAGHVINRLRPPADGDILVPGGTVSVLGTTSVHTDNLETVRPTVAEIDRNVMEGAAMIPALATARYIRAFSRVRPLLQSSPGEDGRAATRGFALLDHTSQGLTNFCTITGGKLTTFRLMAEKTADLVARRLGNTQACTTDSVALPDGDACRWTEPGAAPRYWYKANNADDMILCECEMVPQSAIDEIVKCAPGAEAEMTLEAIALRSRAGKGPCQGSFCGIRIASYLYDRGYYRDTTGLTHMRDFFNERFKGMRTVIWGRQAAQMELAEALHCGLLGLDNLDSDCPEMAILP
ncbi:anaerobic glycerol-3-phosphate dehydrogenase subunit A [Desulfopila sp. IMCC35006]|uniref:anaerobic glycerol-3-phosphate dehydrogenase subunit A n=1 Tax=Desulfopila sp. IMCC35006 TaxID=2569542 RepID=UPI0010AD0F3E|nr:anaerobic glycerol-3-phosphate dehydrogenase subunit A [Desulfopila sp. IMCC35006]TKB25087.1 anaerobic glycerol-3-phosphate dehydrogenase subunit A [Desulfopila sp. IMCC35006]